MFVSYSEDETVSAAIAEEWKEKQVGRKKKSRISTSE